MRVFHNPGNRYFYVVYKTTLKDIETRQPWITIKVSDTFCRGMFWQNILTASAV